MIDPQTATLAGAGLVLALAAIRARLDAMGPSRAVAWAITPKGRGALEQAQRPHPRTRRKTASELLPLAASELARAIEEGRSWDAAAWARRAWHLGRTVKATDARRARYQRRRVAHAAQVIGAVQAEADGLAVAS